MTKLDEIALEVNAAIWERKAFKPFDSMQLEFSRRLLARLEEEGWVLVPKVPTEGMREVIAREFFWSTNIYSAMIEAAPRIDKE